MKISRLLLAGAVLTGLAACEGGGIDLNVATTDNSVDNSVNNSGGGSTNPCASYTPPNSTELRQGTFDGTNCVYSSAFVGVANPLLVDLTLPFISGVHIFQDSLFVGQNVSTGAAPAGGTGPVLTIAAGNKLAFLDSADYVLINRGSQLIADGSPSAPIVFSSFTDLVTGTAGANDVSQWGGIQINGNGITNNCSDTERANNQCHVVTEGQPSNYGGNDNAESSGTLRYVIVKHTGFEVAPGDELNGITFNAVGSGTVVENVQVYSTFDDGLEFFGGAVNVNNAVILYARDDSLDYSDGYIGTIENALVIHWQSDGNRCIEGDNVGDGRTNGGEPADTAPIAEPVVRNMTCIVSNSDVNTHGDSEAVLVRQGGKLRLENSIIYAGYGTSVNGLSSNECYEIDGPADVSKTFAQNGDNFYVRDTIIACQNPIQVDSGVPDALPNGDTVLAWLQDASAVGASYAFNAANTIITDPVNANVQVLQAGTYFTAASIVDASGATVRPGTDLGAVQAGDDWTAPWAFGLRANNADVPLWFAP